MPCRVPIEIDRITGAGPDHVPSVIARHLVSVGKSDGLNTARGVDRPEPDQRPTGKLVVLKIWGGLDTWCAVVGLDRADGVSSSSVSEGVPTRERKLNFAVCGIELGWPSVDLPDSNRPGA